MYNVVGIEKVDYKNRQGRQIKGTALHCMYENENYGGYAVERVYIGGDVDCSAVRVNSNVDILYNKYGKVVKINIIK